MTHSCAIWNADCDAILVNVLFKEWQSGRQTNNAGWHPSAWTTAETLWKLIPVVTQSLPKAARPTGPQYVSIV